MLCVNELVHVVQQHPCSHSPLKAQVMGSSDSCVLPLTPGKIGNVRMKELVCVPAFCPSPDFWSAYYSPRRLEVLQGAPAWIQPKRQEHSGVLLFCFHYLSIFGPNSEKSRKKPHKAGFVLPALQGTAYSKNTFRCFTQSKEIMFLKINVRPLFENINKNRNKSKLKQRCIWSKFDIYEPLALDAHLTGLYGSIRKKKSSFTLEE